MRRFPKGKNQQAVLTELKMGTALQDIPAAINLKKHQVTAAYGSLVFNEFWKPAEVKPKAVATPQFNSKDVLLLTQQAQIAEMQETIKKLENQLRYQQNVAEQLNSTIDSIRADALRNEGSIITYTGSITDAIVQSHKKHAVELLTKQIANFPETFREEIECKKRPVFFHPQNEESMSHLRETILAACIRRSFGDAFDLAFEEEGLEWACQRAWLNSDKIKDEAIETLVREYTENGIRSVVDEATDQESQTAWYKDGWGMSEYLDHHVWEAADRTSRNEINQLAIQQGVAVAGVFSACAPQWFVEQHRQPTMEKHKEMWREKVKESGISCFLQLGYTPA